MWLYIFAYMFQCQNTNIAQVQNTNAVILSRPVERWGAEMGCNEHGVSIGSNSIGVKTSSGSGNGRLFRTDFVR